MSQTKKFPSNYPSGFVVCSCSPPDDESVRLAREWVKEKNLTSDDVKIVKRVDAVCVEIF